MAGECSKSVTHAAGAAAKQLNKVPFQAPLVAARGAREGLWSALVLNRSPIIFQNLQIKSKSVKDGMNRRIFSC